MNSKITLLASALGLSAALASQAQADVLYTVLNPASNFTLFVYDSPIFITTDTAVGVAQLAFANPSNTITGVEFKPASGTFVGTSELEVFQSGGGANQTFTGNQFCTIRRERSRSSASPEETATASASRIQS